MKSNEAPEKIYLSDFTDTTESVFYVKQDNTKKNDIEYVRKDAFIEKAVEHIDGLIEFLNEFGHQLKKERIIENFRKCMED